MERHITDLVKKSLENVTGAEFKMFLDFLNSLSLFGETASPERVQELIEIIEEQADLIEQFNISDGDHIDRLISCLHMALPFFKRGASNSKFLKYLNRHILSVVDKFPEERKLDLLKILAESSPYTAPPDARQLLPAVVLLLKKFMPLRKTREEFNFTYVECLLYTFHYLAFKTPNATNSLCGYKIVTGQPSDRLGEDFLDNYKDFCERLTATEDMARIAMKKLNQGLPELDKTLAAAKNEEEKASLRIEKHKTATGLQTCTNIVTMTQPLHSKSPSFLGDSKITLSWKPKAKSSGSANTNAAGSKRATSAANVSSITANKRPRGESAIQSQLLNRTLKDVFPGGRGGASGRGLNGRGQSERFDRDQFVSRSLRGIFQGGRGGRGQGGVKGRGYQWL